MFLPVSLVLPSRSLIISNNYTKVCLYASLLFFWLKYGVSGGVPQQQTPLNEKEIELIKQFLGVIATKVKYDESYNFEVEDENEVLFMKYRKVCIAIESWL